MGFYKYTVQPISRNLPQLIKLYVIKYNIYLFIYKNCQWIHNQALKK